MTKKNKYTLFCKEDIVSLVHKHLKNKYIISYISKDRQISIIFENLYLEVLSDFKVYF